MPFIQSGRSGWDVLFFSDEAATGIPGKGQRIISVKIYKDIFVAAKSYHELAMRIFDISRILISETGGFSG
jgi:hypothetical protein